MDYRQLLKRFMEELFEHKNPAAYISMGNFTEEEYQELCNIWEEIEDAMFEGIERAYKEKGA